MRKKRQTWVEVTLDSGVKGNIKELSISCSAQGSAGGFKRRDAL